MMKTMRNVMKLYLLYFLTILVKERFVIKPTMPINNPRNMAMSIMMNPLRAFIVTVEILARNIIVITVLDTTRGCSPTEVSIGYITIPPPIPHRFDTTPTENMNRDIF